VSKLSTAWNMLRSGRQQPAGETDFVVSRRLDGTETVTSKKELAKMLNGYVSACQHVIANAIAGLEIRTFKGNTLQTQEVTDNLLRTELTRLTRQTLLYKIASDLVMTGNCYLTRINGVMEYISAEVSVKTWERYNDIVVAPSVYTVSDEELGVRKDVPAKDMIHFKYRTLTGAASGRGSLEDCRLEGDIAAGISRFIRGYFKNGAIPGLHVRIKRGNLPRERFTELARKIESAFSGGGVGGTMVTSDGVTSQVVGNSVVDAKSVEILAEVKKIIFAAYSVPLDVLDSSNSNRATAQTAQRLFQNNTVMPLAWTICYELTDAHKEQGYRFEPVVYDTIDPIEGDKLTIAAVEAGIMTAQEARERMRSLTLPKTQGGAQ